MADLLQAGSQNPTLLPRALESLYGNILLRSVGLACSSCALKKLQVSFEIGREKLDVAAVDEEVRTLSNELPCQIQIVPEVNPGAATGSTGFAKDGAHRFAEFRM